MPLHHLIYQSTATQPFSDDDLRSLLAEARKHNTTHDVSGILLYHDGQFLQVLEGTEGMLRQLYEKIRRDPRHTHVVKLADAPLVQRNFGTWSMAFRPVLAADFAALPGYLNPDALAQAADEAMIPNAKSHDLLHQIMELTFSPQAEVW